MGRAKELKIGSRGGALSALYLERVCASLREAHPHREFVAVHEGREHGAPAVARKGPAAVMQRLAKGTIDAALVDARSLPFPLAAPFHIAAILERTNPFDALISAENCILDDQPDSTCIAAIEPVKRGQLLYYRSDLKVVGGSDDFNRNFTDMERGAIHAFVFPASSVEALNKQEHVVEVFTTSICTPPAGQGALALIARLDRKDVLSVLRDLNDASAAVEIELERMFVDRVTKDGRGAIGVLCNVEENEFEVEAAIVAPDGSERISGIMGGALSERAKVIGKLAGDLLAAGGEDIIASCRKTRGSC